MSKAPPVFGDDYAPLADEGQDAAQEHFQPDPERWWILASFAAIGLLQSSSWNFYAPISGPVKEVFGFSASQTEGLVLSSNITWMLGMPPFLWLAERCGARAPTVLSAALLFIALALRCVPSALGLDNTSNAVWWLSLTGMCLNGAAAPWLNYGAPMISQLWFPPGSRGVATAVGAVAVYYGVSLGFVLGPSLVPDGRAAAPTRDAISRLLWGQAAAAAIVLAAVAARWPAAPRAPSSRSAAAAVGGPKPEEEVSGGLLPLLLSPRTAARRRLWATVLAYAAPLGMFAGWVGVLDVNLAALGVAQGGAANLGLAMSALGSTAGVCTGALADAFAGRMKEFTLVCYALATGCFAGFALLVVSSGGAHSSPSPSHMALANVLAVAGGVMLNAPVPLGFELLFEIAAGSDGDGDVSAPAAAALSSAVCAAVQITFLALPIRSLGVVWMNWAMAAVAPLAAVPFALMEARYPRLELDRGGIIARSAIDAFGLF